MRLLQRRRSIIFFPVCRCISISVLRYTRRQRESKLISERLVTSLC